jgi:type II secretory pathway pseudopilin PulG
MELMVVVTIIAALSALVVGIVDHSRDDAEVTVAKASMKTIAEGISGSAGGSGYLADFKTVPGFHVTGIRVHDLFSPSSYPAYGAYDPAARRGWRGPYLRHGAGVANLESSRSGRFPEAGDKRFAGDASFLDRGFFNTASFSPYGVPGDLGLADPWGNPYVIQTPPVSAFAGVVTNAKRFRYSRVVSAGPDGALTTPADRLAGKLTDGLTPARGDDLVLFLNRADIYEDEEP